MNFLKLLNIRIHAQHKQSLINAHANELRRWPYNPYDCAPWEIMPISKPLSKGIGVKNALILNLIGYSLQYPKQFHLLSMRVNSVSIGNVTLHGRKWVRCPIRFLRWMAPYETSRSILRQVKWLEKHRFIYAKEFRKKYGDRTTWFTVNTDEYNQVVAMEAKEGVTF